MAVLGHLSKLKGSLELAFGAYFWHDFSLKCFLFNTLSIDKVSMLYHFPFSRYQAKCVIMFSFRQLMTS